MTVLPLPPPPQPGPQVAAQHAGATRADLADVAHVLVLLQAGAGLLAMLGEVVMMGSPIYLIAPVANAALLIILSVLLRRGRIWAAVTLVAVEVATVVGFMLSTVVGLLPGVDFTINLVGLLTGIGIPVAIVVLCIGLLVTRARAGAATGAVAGAVAGSAPVGPVSPHLEEVVR